MTRKKTILKMQNYLNEINDLIKVNSRLHSGKVDEIGYRYKTTRAAFYYAVQAKYFRRISQGNYAPVINHFEPIHARHVQEFIVKRANELRTIRNSKTDERRELTQQEIQFNKKQDLDLQKKKQAAVDRLPKINNSKPQQKTFSLFWGLIKFNY
tara:strand:+ start:259 stop:720 length:462 start_codon:yes stop_codon:yes gene_type:complete